MAAGVIVSPMVASTFSTVALLIVVTLGVVVEKLWKEGEALLVDAAPPRTAILLLVRPKGSCAVKADEEEEANVANKAVAT